MTTIQHTRNQAPATRRAQPNQTTAAPRTTPARHLGTHVVVDDVDDAGRGGSQRGLFTQVSMLPTDMRDVQHSRLLEQIRSGNSSAPDVRALHDGAALAVRAGTDVFPYYSDHFFELAFPLLFPYGTSRPCFKRHHKFTTP